MSGIYSLENWFFFNQRKIDEIFDYIVFRIKNEIYITNPILYFNLNEDKLYHYIVRYLYKVSNNRNKHLMIMR